MKTIGRALALVQLGFVALAAAAGAYSIDTDGRGHQLHWARFPVTYHLVGGNIPGGGNGEQAIHSAFQAWEDASSAINYDFGGYVGQGMQANDGMNIVYFVNQGWPYDPSLAAITFRYFSTGDGHILDADIIFDGENYDWSVGGSNYDIQNVATHEIGHFGGFGHSVDNDATMFATTTARETGKRTLGDDDIAAIDALYGGVILSSTSTKQVVGSSSSGTGGSGGGCSLGGADNAPAGPADLGCVVLVLAFVLLAQRWSRKH